MKKIFLLLLCFTLLFSGCTNRDSLTSKEEITIEFSKDGTVNGYRSEVTSLPDVIDASNVTPGTEIEVITSYYGNKNSKKFHKSSCSSLKNTKDENIIHFQNKQDFLENGYTPCKLCNP